MSHGPKRLREWIDRSKITQRHAAELLKVHEVYLSQLLAGDRNPGLDTALRIEDVTGISARSWQHITVSADEGEPIAAGAKRRSAKR